jgi:hypothetical protein
VSRDVCANLCQDSQEARLKAFLGGQSLCSFPAGPPSTYPCVASNGFERLYNAQLKTRSLDDQTRTIFEKGMGPIAWVIEPKTADDRETDNNRMRVMIEGALGLFGLIDPLRDSDSCAWSDNGICAYRTILRNLPMHNEFGYSLGRIHIVPGRIEWQNRSYDQIQDLSDLPPFDFRTDDNRIDPTQLLGFERPSLELKETLKDSDCMLMGGFRLPNINKLPLFIAPTNIGNCAMMAHGLYQCQRRASCNEKRQASGAMPEFHVHKRHGKEVAVYKAPNDRSIFAAIAIGSLLEEEYLPLCGGECLECALRTATDELEPFTQDNAPTDARTRQLLVIVRLCYINTGEELRAYRCHQNRMQQRHALLTSGKFLACAACKII